MPKKATIHYTAGGLYPVCGIVEGQWADSTNDPAKVTCKACRRSTAFKTRHPELANDTPTGRPSAKGVQRTFKVYLPEDLNDWINAQDSFADTIVQALSEKQKRDKKSKKK